MQDSEKNGNASTVNSESGKKCERCGGSGMYIYMQSAREYAKINNKEYIYGDRDFDIPVGRKCPFCNGGFAEEVQKARNSSDIPFSFNTKTMKDFDWNAYIDETGKTYDTSAQRECVETYINKFNEWEESNSGLYIYSKTKGSGKTFLASCLCNELMAKYAIRTRFVRASELIDISQSGDKNSYDEYKRNPMKLLYECKFLVIDDIGQKITGGEWLEDILFKLLDYRMTNKRLTFCTSNLTIPELRFNERLVERIEKLCMPFHLPEVSVRSKEIRENRQQLLKKLGLIKEGNA